LGTFDILKIQDDCGDQDTAAIITGRVKKRFYNFRGKQSRRDWTYKNDIFFFGLLVSS
jgi:hypothetical protein